VFDDDRARSFDELRDALPVAGVDPRRRVGRELLAGIAPHSAGAIGPAEREILTGPGDDEYAEVEVKILSIDLGSH
jgi:hypothetical protein